MTTATDRQHSDHQHSDDRHSDHPHGAIVECPGCGRRNRTPAAAKGTPRCRQCHQALPWLVHAGDDTYAAVTTGSTPVLVDLWAPWCGPCRMIEPAVEEVTRRYAGKLKTVKVNVDEAPQTAGRLGVQGVPTLLVLKDGQVAARQVGALPGPSLQRWVEAQLGEAATI